MMEEISEHVRVCYVRCVALTSEAVGILKAMPGIADASLSASSTLLVTKVDRLPWSEAEVGVFEFDSRGV